MEQRIYTDLYRLAHPTLQEKKTKNKRFALVTVRQKLLMPSHSVHMQATPAGPVCTSAMSNEGPESRILFSRDQHCQNAPNYLTASAFTAQEVLWARLQ